ncbi:MAG: DNA/RNA non-specific endonuclease [Treponema sp.]|nr:DNA/RNA non-specific endonuclease [Treponema sp.]
MSRKKRKSYKSKILFAFGIIIAISVVALAGIWYCTHKAGVKAPSSEPPAQATGEPQAAEEAQSTEQPAPSPQEAQQQATSPCTDGLIQLPSNLAVPRCAAHTHDSDHELRHFTDYDICYRESYEQAEWSAYQLEKSELVKNARRSDDFRPDPEISTGSATLSDYRKSGYDRGHLAPAADFAYSQTAMSETFFMSNMTAQAPQFNRGVWKKLEDQVRTWARTYGRAYVICGPVLDEPAESYATIGANKVVIPRYFYKIILLPLYADEADAATPDDCADLTAYAFIIPNKNCDDGFTAYRVTIDEVEARTGIDFFYALEDSVEARIEAACN